MNGVKSLRSEKAYHYDEEQKLVKIIILEFGTKLTEFQHFVIGLHRRNKYSLSQISKAEETAVFFDMPHNYIANFKREKQMAMKTTGYKELRLIVMLRITATGNKLPPYVILNRKTEPKQNFCKDRIVQVPPPQMHR
jgi:hypothetical protein